MPKQNDKKGTQSAVLRRVLVYLKPHLPVLALSLLLSLIAVALTLYVPILVGRAIDCIVGPGEVNFAALGPILTTIAVCVLLTAGAQWVQNVLNQPYGLNVLTLRVSVRAVTYSFYFDGTSEYALRQEAEEPLQVVTALVPLSSLAEVQLTGTGAYNGSLCRAEAQVGTQRVALTLTADGPAFPCESRQEADGTIRTEQPWRALMVDESGTVYRMQRAGDGEDMQDDALHLTLTGSGRLPARATVYVYRCAEGDAAPDEAQICAGEGIPLTVTDGMEN